MSAPIFPVPVIHHQQIPWSPHPRYPDIFFKKIVGGDENPAMSVGMVNVPPGKTIGIHTHPDSVETIYCLMGQGLLTVQNVQTPFTEGSWTAIPKGMEHGMHNATTEPLLLITLFTPPIF
ncbi:MAG: cupin domain-containing protein [Caldilineales bacterium]|nr:cupin domain-containing protein [Caldilineales bacterium]